MVKLQGRLNANIDGFLHSKLVGSVAACQVNRLLPSDLTGVFGSLTSED
jgi:hypothetical protein